MNIYGTLLVFIVLRKRLYNSFLIESQVNRYPNQINVLGILRQTLEILRNFMQITNTVTLQLCAAYKPGKEDEVDQFIATLKPSDTESKTDSSSEYEDYWDSYEVHYSLFMLLKMSGNEDLGKQY